MTIYSDAYALPPYAEYRAYNGDTIRVEMTDRRDHRGAHVWAYVFSTADGRTVLRREDLTGHTTDPVEMLDTLASFLSAWDEAMRYADGPSENSDLFSPEFLPFLEHAEDLYCDTLYAREGDPEADPF